MQINEVITGKIDDICEQNIIYFKYNNNNNNNNTNTFNSNSTMILIPAANYKS
ncbi:hypothetical protein SASC598J21_005820 [Snodgrassella alvi SCGC AB-598-J21]|uniref:Uncharacterized protein n=1 Tax=Snodgrassella alvi SCGC AB-598-J21 TaxID=1385367 RepID=A0A074VGQ5_9NEIS|nr:hypothetical protein SASC598J21_007000 [Snodgrassella alvi SCGC AB-598-J21]KEQ01640.1 hypothetical protein SASC598J21_005820 [Snodgrassella alvi SCGC AB-598-J21]